VEVWKSIPGAEGRYEVSSHGRVRSLDRTTVTKTGVVKRTQGLQLLTHPNTAGYLCLRLGRGMPVMVHQLVALAFLGARPAGAYVCHGDGNKLNNRADNLRYDTPKSNQHDRIKHGTACRGERAGSAKLTEAQAQWAKANFGTQSNQEIAKLFGVSRASIYLIGKGRNWRHLDATPPTT
jgi:hypothetical protein